MTASICTIVAAELLYVSSINYAIKKQITYMLWYTELNRLQTGLHTGWLQ